jgi:hypothetical protein
MKVAGRARFWRFWRPARVRAKPPAGIAQPHRTSRFFQRGSETLRSLALNLERLHAFISARWNRPRAHREIRVILSPAQEYSQYRSKPAPTPSSSAPKAATIS